MAPDDFFRLGYPLLRRFGFPVTVYQTTYYSDRQIPVFNLILFVPAVEAEG